MQDKMKDFNLNFTNYKKGDIITGTIVMIGKTGVIVNIGGMRDGVVPKNEINNVYKEGDATLVMVTDEIDENGCIVLNAKDVNRAISQREQISNTKVGSTIEFKIDSIGTSGLTGEFCDFKVFLPFSQCSKDDYLSKETLQGRIVEAVVLEINSLQKSMVVSSKILKKVVDTSNIKIKEGDIVIGTAFRVMDKYALVMLEGGVRAKIGIQDVSYETVVNNMKDVLVEGLNYEFKVLECNADFSRISLGFKQLKASPFEELFNSISLGDEVTGVVEKIFPTGAMIKLENGLSAFALTQENSERVNTATHHIYKLGQTVTGYISNKDEIRQKLNIITMKKKETNQ